MASLYADAALTSIDLLLFRLSFNLSYPISQDCCIHLVGIVNTEGDYRLCHFCNSFLQQYHLDVVYVAECLIQEFLG